MPFRSILKAGLLSDGWLFLFLLSFYGYFYQGGFANQNSRFDQTLAIVTEHRLAIDTFHQNTIDKIQFADHFYSEKAPGTSYLAVPVTFVAHELGLSKGLPSEQTGNILLYLATLFSVSLISGFAAVAFRRLLIILNPALTSSQSFGLTILVFLCTLCLPYSTVLMGHQLAGSFIVIGLYFLKRHLHTNKFSLGFMALFVWGFAVITEYTSLIPILFIGIGFLPTLGLKRTATLLSGVLIPAVILLLHNMFIFHHAFSIGYGNLANTEFGEQMQQGFFGVRLPSLQNIAQLLLGFYRGLLVYSPILILTVIGFMHWSKSEKSLRNGILLGAMSAVVLNSSYVYWQGGVCFGPRHLVLIIPILGLSLAFIPVALFKNPFLYLLAMLSFLINLIGVSTTLYVGERETNPLWNAYLPMLKNGFVSINPVGFMTSAIATPEHWRNLRNYEWNSFNLGEVVGLHGWCSLLPLMFIAAVTIINLFWASDFPTAESRK